MEIGCSDEQVTEQIHILYEATSSFFSLYKLCLEISLHYDTTLLSCSMSFVYLIAPCKGTIILILQRGTESTLLQQTDRPVSSQKLHINVPKYKVKKKYGISPFMIAHTNWVVNP